MYKEEKRSNMPYKTIREVCAITGTTENALRYYDEKKLLSPVTKKQTGRREWLYDESSIWRLKLIMLYRKMGISVYEIRAVFEENENLISYMLERRIQLLRKEKETLEKQINLAEVMLLIESISNGDANEESRNKLVDELIRKEIKEEE